METINKADLLNLVKQPKLLVSLLGLFTDGEIPIKLFGNKNHLVSLFTKLQTAKRLPNLEKTLSTSELALLNRQMTSKDKKRLCNNNFHLMKLLLTSVLVSTLNDEDYNVFYDWLCQTVLTKLLFQAKTDCVDLDLSSSNGYSINTIQKSWFSSRLQLLKTNNSSTTFYPLSKFIAASGTDVEDTILRTKKIKLRLTSNQRQMLQTWNSHARYTYNSAVWRLNTDIDIQTKLNLRNQITPANCNNGKEWILQTPKEIRARAVFEAHTRFWTCIKQIKNKTIKFFNLRFKDKKHQNANGWSIDIPKQAIKQTGAKTMFIYKNVTNKEQFKLSERLDIPIEHDCKIHFDGDAFYLIVPFKKVKKTREQDGIVSLDPGVRTFLTGVDGNKTIELGKDSGTILFRKLRHLDKLISKKSKTKDKHVRKTLNKQIKKVRICIRNLQGELHKKASTWLCKNYSNVVIPQFGSKDMVKNKERKLKTKTVRAMSILAHSRFLERLKNKAEEWRTNVVIVDEKYTSKTCSVCGHVKTKRFTSKVYDCKSCLITMDRDRNGAINIFKKLFLPKGEDRADRANVMDKQDKNPVHTELSTFVSG